MNALTRHQVEGHTLVVRTLDAQTDGPPVVCLHGITASVFFWTPSQVAPFTDLGPCYALSLPGHYPATFPAGFSEQALTAEHITNVLAQALRAHAGDEPAVLIGHSTGGFAALALAARYPKQVRAVISLAGFAQGRWQGALGLEQRLARQRPIGRWLFRTTYALNRLTRAGQRASWAVYTPRPRRLFASPHFDEVFAGVYPAFKRLDLQAMAQYFAVMPDVDITGWLPDIKAPTLVVTGDQDTIIPPSQARWIARHIPSAAVEIIKGAGHILTVEQPEAYRRTVKEWLDRLGLPSIR
jgi:pimeloyl-ACP methyl ester carboxylesterase